MIRKSFVICFLFINNNMSIKTLIIIYKRELKSNITIIKCLIRSIKSTKLTAKAQFSTI